MEPRVDDRRLLIRQRSALSLLYSTAYPHLCPRLRLSKFIGFQKCSRPAVGQIGQARGHTLTVQYKYRIVVYLY